MIIAMYFAILTFGFNSIRLRSMKMSANRRVIRERIDALIHADNLPDHRVVFVCRVLLNHRRLSRRLISVRLSRLRWRRRCRRRLIRRFLTFKRRFMLGSRGRWRFWR